MTIKRKTTKTKRKASTRKPTVKRKTSTRRRNPESMYDIGYAHGIEDIDENQYFPEVLGEQYINTLGRLLKTQKYRPDFDKFHDYVKGYLDAGLDKGTLKKSDKTRAQEYVDRLKKDTSVLFMEFPKMIFILDTLGGEATLEDLVKARNEHKPFVTFIVEGLVELGYVEKVGRKYELTSKGARSLPFIIHANKVSRPDQFADVERYLKRG